MIITKIFLILFLVSISLWANPRIDWEMIVPQNKTLTFKGMFIPEVKRISESVSHIEPSGQVRIKQLKHQGFICLRQSQEKTLCSLAEKNQTLPEDLKFFVNQKLKNFRISFFQFTQEPILLIDTSTQKEWAFFQKLQIGEQIVDKYKLAYVYENQSYYIALQTSSEQPFSLINIINPNQVSIKMVTSSKVGNQNIGYIFYIVLDSFT